MMRRVLGGDNPVLETALYSPDSARRSYIAAILPATGHCDDSKTGLEADEEVVVDETGVSGEPAPRHIAHLPSAAPPACPPATIYHLPACLPLYWARHWCIPTLGPPPTSDPLGVWPAVCRLTIHQLICCTLLAEKGAGCLSPFVKQAGSRRR